jgi:hypothetical protein
MAQRPERIAARIPRRLQPVPRRRQTMRNKIEQGYIDQGYQLPAGLTWARVDALRLHWRVNPLLVPEAVGGGCIGWGVPFVDGKPMKHP